MDLSQKTEVLHPAENHTWLGKAEGFDEMDSITLDPALFDLETDFPDGFIPSGVVLGKVTATGKYGPYDDTADGDPLPAGLEVARGHLGTTVVMDATSVNVSAALFTHGQVVEANLPTGHGLDAAGKADLTHIRYV